MKSCRVIVGVLLLALCFGCFDSTDPDIDDFRLTLEVIDTDGGRVANLHAKLHVPIPEMQFAKSSFNGAKPATKIEFIVPEPGRITLTIYDLAGDSVLHLLENEPCAAGPHQMTYYGQNDEGESLVGTCVLRCEMIGRHTDSNEILYEHSEWMTLYTAVDYQQRPVLGFTDAEGRVRTEDNLLVPFLHELPDLQIFRDDMTPAGPFTISDVVTITLTDTLSSQRQDFDIHIVQGSNFHRLVWDPQDPKAEETHGHAAPVSAPASSVTSIKRSDPLPPWLLRPCYPNPFN